MTGPHIFISYSHKDEPFVRTLAQHMQAAGLEPWYYIESQRGGIDWTQGLMASIEAASAVIVVLSPHSANAENVLLEILRAKKCHKPIIPISLAPCDGAVIYHLEGRNWISCWDGRDPLPRLLVDLTSPVPGPAPLLPDDAPQLVVIPSYAAVTRHAIYTLALPNVEALELPTMRTLCTIGRGAQQDIFIKHTYVSREHAYISLWVERDDIAFVLADGNPAGIPSHNGTYVNGKRLEKPAILEDGDQIGLGSHDSMLSFSWLGETKTVQVPLSRTPMS